jgi:hypothetical protein
VKLYDDEVVAAADAEIDRAIQALLGESEEAKAVVGVAPAGAGKSYAVGTAVVAARARALRVAVASPTNEQAFALVSGIADRLPGEAVAFVPAGGVTLPEANQRPNVVEKKAKDTPSDPIIVGTLNKLGDAYARGDLAPVDVLLVDEAYQANSVHYYVVGDLARRHLMMGDSGQLAPFSAAPEADRWRGLDEDPLLTAVEVLLRNHPHTPVHRLPITRRLDPRALPIARAFYPDHTFGAAVLPGVRRLELSAKGGRTSIVIDAALDQASVGGWAHIEMPESAVVAADPETIGLIVDLLRRLFERTPTTCCERQEKPRALRQEDVAVVVSHNSQKDMLRVTLDGAGLGGVVVNTANKVQGLAFEVVVAWHPLAGLLDVDEFHLDPGRLCVMLTRHRQACIVVGRAGDRKLVEGIPPATPGYVGWDLNPALEGWYVHEAVFDALGRHRIAVPR